MPITTIFPAGVLFALCVIWICLTIWGVYDHLSNQVEDSADHEGVMPRDELADDDDSLLPRAKVRSRRNRVDLRQTKLAIDVSTEEKELAENPAPSSSRKR